MDLKDLKGKTSPNDAAGKVEDDHAEDSAAGRHQLASPCGGRDVAVADAVESDEGPPQRVPHAREVGLVVQLLLEKEDKEGGEEENDGADVGRREQFLSLHLFIGLSFIGPCFLLDHF